MVDWVSQEVLALISPVLANHPPLVTWTARPSFCAIEYINYPTGPILEELPRAIHFRNYIEKAPVYDMEFAFNFDKTKLVEIITVVTKKVDDYKKYGQYPLNIAMEMRVMGHSGALLCPGIIGNTEYGGSGQVLFIEVLSVINTKQWTRFCTEVGLKWMKLGGIPHLAKQWDFLPNIEDYIYKSKKIQIDEFTKQLKESNADPKGMFLNESIKRLLRL
ncbi:uncharacterized protein LOC134701115 [Mytilus trossulus]|uniref:uncharacterized protein LOC134701115 n=1 Tax=Mytilus trossulus TaxID=6551 RepID=UPI003006C2DF